eukprot:2035854-Prorocentrum_lima.AAC.1
MAARPPGSTTGPLTAHSPPVSHNTAIAGHRTVSSPPSAGCRVTPEAPPPAGGGPSPAVAAPPTAPPPGGTTLLPMRSPHSP